MKAGEGGRLVCTFPRIHNLMASCQNIMSICFLLRDFGSHSPSLAHMCYLGLGLWRLSDGANWASSSALECRLLDRGACLMVNKALDPKSQPQEPRKRGPCKPCRPVESRSCRIQCLFGRKVTKLAWTPQMQWSSKSPSRFHVSHSGIA